MAGRKEPKQVYVMGKGKAVHLVPDKWGSFFHFRVDNVGKKDFPEELMGRFTTEAEAMKALAQLDRRVSRERRAKTVELNKRMEKLDAEAERAQA